MYHANELRIAQELQKKIADELDRLGLLFRVFSRAKSENSICKKKCKEPGKYSADGKKIQDLFGVRIILYFPDDLEIAQSVLERLYQLDSKAVDEAKMDIFSATRCNYVCKLPESFVQDSSLLKKYDFIDNTFEVQFRTILSEGWHEVEHDLRYKCKDDWKSHDDLSRALNGIYASLETSDWGIMKLFEELAYRHYKASEWSAMFRTKLRLRTEDNLTAEIIDIINKENLGKDLYRINRNKILSIILMHDINIPISLNNMIFICNFFLIRSEALTLLAPELIIKKLSEAVEKHSSQNSHSTK